MDSKLSTDNYSDYFLDVNQTISVKDGEFSCYLCNATYEKDLQLAAELGKTLLERNKELESALKNHQNIIEDQSQEIEYLTKQTAALKEVNSSRFKIYEQLEISIQDLEHANVTLSQQSASDKKQIKSLLETIQSLENKCDELQQQLDKKVLELENENRQRTAGKNTHANEPTAAATDDNNFSGHHNQPNDVCTNCSEILARLQEAKASNVKEQRIIDDLKDQLSVVLQDNDYLRNQVDNLQHKEDEMKSVQDELATLEQIRLGNLCKRCLRSTVATEDFSSADELSVLMTNDDDDDEILANIRSAVADFSLDKSDNGENPYRLLVEKYEALCKMQEQQNYRRIPSKIPCRPGVGSTTPAAGISLQDELRAIGGYYDAGNARPAYRAIETDSECEEEPVTKPTTVPTTMGAHVRGSVSPKNGSDGDLHTKSTQTEVLVGSLPGSFLCRISDGNDCQFSIYDDASPIESRFRKTPEYRHLFREIFAVLKRAAEAKDEGETLPLLDDRLPASAAASGQPADNHPKVPPVTPAREDVPFISPLSSSSPPPSLPLQQQDEQQIINDLKAEPSSNQENNKEDQNTAVMLVTTMTTTTTSSNENCDSVREDPVEEVSAAPAPRDIMEQLASGVKLRDSKRDRRVNAVHHHASPSPSPCSSRSASKRRAGSKARRKKERLTDSPSRSRERHQQKSNRPVDSELLNMPDVVVQRPHHKERPVSMFGFCGGSSSASKEVAKLKILEKSYAEVLRMGRKKSTSVSKISLA